MVQPPNRNRTLNLGMAESTLFGSPQALCPPHPGFQSAFPYVWVCRKPSSRGVQRAGAGQDNEGPRAQLCRHSPSLAATTPPVSWPSLQLHQLESGKPPFSPPPPTCSSTLSAGKEWKPGCEKAPEETNTPTTQERKLFQHEGRVPNNHTVEDSNEMSERTDITRLTTDCRQFILLVTPPINHRNRTNAKIACWSNL